ncbi:MAG: GAG-pre-integrase domain-containing protein, partial [bacterium]
MDTEVNRNLLTMHSKITRDDQPSEVAMTASISRTPKALPTPLWHKRLGHISPDRLSRMQQLQLGIKLKAASSPAPCEACAITKSVRLPSGNGSTSRDYEPFEKVGCDIWSHSTPSLRGFHHLL